MDKLKRENQKNPVISQMLAHSSVRNFTAEKIPAEDLEQILEAGRAASSWKNFQSYSIIVLESEAKKEAVYNLQPQKAIRDCSVYLVFVGDLNRAKIAVEMNEGDFQPQGIESVLISSVDAGIAAENVLLAAESLGYGGVMVGLIRDQSIEISEVLELPDYVYPLFGIALGIPAKTNSVKPRLPKESVVFKEKYQEQNQAIIKAYDKVQADYAGDRRLNKWSERILEQWGQPEIGSSTENLKRKNLL